jgi:SAM-dependent methyltransferase
MGLPTCLAPGSQRLYLPGTGAARSAPGPAASTPPEMHRNSQLLFERYALHVFSPESSVLEIGPDQRPSTYQRLAEGCYARWDTLDISSRTDIPLTYTAVGEYEFPVADGSYDIVLSGQVIEHVRKIWVWMREVARICRPGGHVVTINPVSWHYHEAPIDCWRIYPEGMKALSEDAGLEVVTSYWGSEELRGLELRSPSILRKQHVWQRLSGVLGMANAILRFPPAGAYDTVTVARKPLPALD